MGGAAVSSADTGAFSSGIELMQSNVRTEMQTCCQCHSFGESDINPIVSIHGAGGHLMSFGIEWKIQVD
jgi:phosphoribosylformylglycinamidine synthase